MQVLIISVNHQIQPRLIKGGSSDGSVEAFERGQKERFAQLLQTKIRERSMEFLGEEARYDEETIAQKICELENCRYANIDMTPEERERRNIPPGYADEGSKVCEAEIARCHREREQYMCQKALAETGESKSILLICGRTHAGPMNRELERRGHSVEIIDLKDQSWYVENWAEHCTFNL